MIREKDLYTMTLDAPITYKDKPLARIYLHCEARQIIDLRNLTAVKAYRVTCTQRIVLPSTMTITRPDVGKSDFIFARYPGMINTGIVLTAPSGVKMRVVDYSPRTINSSISAATNQSQGQNNTFTTQHTRGSSTSETNTYSASASVGVTGEGPTGSLGGDYSNATTNERNESTMTAAEQAASAEHGGSDTMTIKDWASYAFVDASNTMPSWVWAQEYPSDVFQYFYLPTFPLPNDDTTTILLPPLVMNQLFDNPNNPSFAYPPSQLSILGLDFTMKAVWLVDLPNDLTQQVISAQSSMMYTMATHGIINGVGYVQFHEAQELFQIPSQTLDLTLLGLDPIRDGSARNGAVIGFIASKFIGPPPSNGSTFKILSDANTLQVWGAGFDSPMLATFSKEPATLKVQFKIIDSDYSYTLFMKHWKTTGSGCVLTFMFNGDHANLVVRHVDWAEGEGGEDNLSSIVMRNKDYTSIDYHDYLVMGVNTVDITIKSDDGEKCGYFLRALAIGEG